jgi:hypothetical protein
MNFLGVASAQDTIYVTHSTVPQMHGHEFVQLPLVGLPFVNSTFHTRLGVSSTNGITIPLPDFLPDTLRGLTGELVYVNLAFKYNQRIKDWISFYAEVNINVRSGTELGSIISEGINTLTGGKTGVVFRLLEKPRHYLSGSVEVSNYDANIIDIGQFVKDIIENNPDPSITKDAPALSVGIAARYAFAWTKVIGVVANGRLLYGENIVRGDDAFRAEVSTAVDLNFKSKGVPLGLVIGYQLTSAPEIVYVEDELARTAAFKLAYTGAPNFLVGIEINSTSIPLGSTDDNARAIGALVNISYWFN